MHVPAEEGKCGMIARFARLKEGGERDYLNYTQNKSNSFKHHMDARADKTGIDP